ncbi:MAG: antibiotic biosynthesis monooxygenase [Bacteroidales bacterium]|jgi:quinol monooxygenase YgiN|nr:antibiotic biosynthesis monooxygenase [Bacteroidales bacterium]
MKKVIMFFCAAMLIAACCNQGNKSCGKEEDKACCEKSEAKSCCKEPKKIISARVFIKADKVADFIAATKSLLELSRAEEGNVSYSLFQDPEDPTKFMFFEEWKNQAAVEVHFATEHFKKFGETLNACGSQPADITVYDSVAEKKAE